MIKILLIEDLEAEVMPIIHLLTTEFEAKVDRVATLHGAVEAMESSWVRPDLIICDYHGNSFALLKCMLELSQGVPCILVVDDPALFADFKKIKQTFITDPVPRKGLLVELQKRVAGLEEDGVFIKETVTQEPDKRTKVVLAEQERKIDELIAQPKPDLQLSRAATETSLKLVQEVTAKIGFTPQVQAIATKSVELALKNIGESPKLAEIVRTMKAQEGKFITSHSMMLAEIASGLACQLEWSSASTFHKLTMAAFLHDLTMSNNELAKCRTIEEAKALPNISAADLTQFKLHTVQAAELARKFHEIPADVDTIIAQHHELPGGTGFPRGLFQSQLAPLSAVFIVAEDLLHFYLERDFRANVMQFVHDREGIYSTGVLRKALKVLENNSAELNSGTGFSR